MPNLWRNTQKKVWSTMDPPVRFAPIPSSNQTSSFRNEFTTSYLIPLRVYYLINLHTRSVQETNETIIARVAELSLCIVCGTIRLCGVRIYLYKRMHVRGQRDARFHW